MKLFDSGFLCGRFQTLTLGHVSLIDAGLDMCDRMIIFVGSSQECGTETNPFNINTRIRMIHEVYGHDPNIMIYGLPDLTNSDDITPDWGKYLLREVDKHIHKAPELMIYGNDKSRSEWFAPEDIKDTSEFIIPRSRNAISATMARSAMANDNRKLWMSLVHPRLHKMYDELRAELREVEYYRR